MEHETAYSETSNDEVIANTIARLAAFAFFIAFGLYLPDTLIASQPWSVAIMLVIIWFVTYKFTLFMRRITWSK